MDKTNNINKGDTAPDERYLSNLEKHIERAKEAQKYSADRFDILLISLSSTALALSIGFVNNVVPDLKATDTSLLKTSWLLFVVTLISNLTSQVSGYYAHVYDIKTTRNLIRAERGKNQKGNQKKFETYCSNLNNTTNVLNAISLLCLFGGIITIVSFFSRIIKITRYEQSRQ